MRTTILAATLLLPAVANAQITRHVPPDFGDVEGNRSFTYPFGRADAAAQVLVDAPWVTTGVGIINVISMRPEGSLTATYAGYSKAYTLTLWTTPVTAAAMTADPIANIAGTTPTVGFSGTLNLPTAAPTTRLPAPFSVVFPLTTPYVFVGTSGNLLLQIDTADLTTPPGSWNVDAVFQRSTSHELILASVSPACANGNGHTLNLTPDRTSGAIGGAFNFNFRQTTTTAFALAAMFLGSTNRAPGFPLDLTGIGMPSCALAIDMLANQIVVPVGGVFPSAQWPVPASPWLVDLPLYHQALGLASTASLSNAVMSEAWVTMVHPGTPYPTQAQSIFYVASTARWAIGAGGGLTPVLELDGIFP